MTIKCSIENKTLDPTWLQEWEWGDGVDPEQAIIGAKVMWEQIVEDVEQHGRPMFMPTSDGMEISVNILGQGEHHVCFRLADMAITDGVDDRMGIAGALFAVAFKIAAGK